MKGHSAIFRSGLADRLIAEASQNEFHSILFVPFPQSLLKYELKQNLFLKKLAKRMGRKPKRTLRL